MLSARLPTLTHQFTVTDPYTDPHTGVLFNKLGVTDSAQLELTEFQIVALRDSELTQSPYLGSFDLDHLRSIHKYLFSDIYDWAGSIRTVTISKPNAVFCRAQYILDAAPNIFALISDRDHMRNLDREAAAAALAEFLGELNALHPFRDGNGRTQRAFLRQLAATAGWRLDWTGLNRSENIEASIARDEYGLPTIRTVTCTPLI